MEHKPHILLLDGKAADPRPTGAPYVDAEGVRHQKFVRPILKTGLYTHPRDGWKMNIDTDRLDRLAAAFGRMKDDGEAVEVVVDHSWKAEDAYGHAEEIFREGDWLFAVYDVRTDKGIQLAQQVPTSSVWIEPEHKTGTGTSYGEAITHCSLVTQPVIPGQVTYLKAAAVRGKAASRAAVLSRQENSQMDLSQFKELLGTEQDLTEDGLFGVVKQYIEGREAERQKLDGQVNDLRAELASVKAKAASQRTPEPDKDVLEETALLRQEGIDNLIERGNITPAVGKKLSALLVGEPGKRNAYMLSRVTSGLDTPPSLELIKILAENNPVELKEATGSQARRLGRETPDGPKGPDESARKDFADLAWGHVGGK